jgi:hypothetical protein
MKHFLPILLFAFLIISCKNEKSNLIITGQIAGLKKGTLYLQKLGDTSLVNVDSIQVEGSSDFSFTTYIDEPQIMFIELDRNDGDDYADLINFFAEPGELRLMTSLKNYGIDLKITSNFENQKKLEDYNEVIKQFNNQRLDLMEANFKASKSQDEEKLDSLNKRFNSILKRRYLYTVNFALNNKNLEVSPYILLSEAYDANIKYLDTVYNALDKPIKKSLYGKKLNELIKERKKNDKKSVETEVIEEVYKK